MKWTNLHGGKYSNNYKTYKDKIESNYSMTDFQNKWTRKRYMTCVIEYLRYVYAFENTLTKKFKWIFKTNTESKIYI